MKVLFIAEHDHLHIKSATYHAASAAKRLGDEIDILLMGQVDDVVTKTAGQLSDMTRVLVAESDCYNHHLPENCAMLIANLGEHYDYILAGSTTFGKNLLPRVAALLDVAMIGDVMQIVSPDTFVRPIYAGNVLSTIQSIDKIKVLTVRTTAFDIASTQSEHSAPIEKVTQAIPNILSRFESQSLTQTTRPELTAARIIIAGGRGLKSAENFKMLEVIADRLGAALGASRAAVDAGFAPNDYQIGQTGKVVAPDLYIAVGISGAIQHLAGMKDSRCIVAINHDPDAPIFDVADYALVGDLFKILPELARELDKML